MSSDGAPATPPVVDLVVIGAGLSGLAAAWTAHRHGWRVCVLEAGRTPGGKVRSERRDGYLLEWGPMAFPGSARAVWKLIEDIGLQSDIVAGQPPGDRFVYRNRRARRLPQGPGSLLSGDYMSLGGKLRMLAEPFVLGNAREDDTVMSFARRRLGREAAQYLIAPFVSGVFAGDPDQLGARDAFPRLWQWEHDAGSVLMGAVLGRASAAGAHSAEDGAAAAEHQPGLYSFREGLATLPRALAAALPAGTVHTSAVAQGIEPHADATYSVRYAATKDASEVGQVRARHVIIAVPPRAASGLVRAIPEAYDALAQVDMCRVAVVHFGGPDPQGIAPRGVGVVIPPGEGLRTLGILLPSSALPGRAPPGHWLHAGFVGGICDPDAVDLTDETLLSLVRRAQMQAFGHLHPGQELACTFSTVVRWRDAIPQYGVGHREAMARAVAAVETTWPGVTLAGNHLHGIHVNDAAHSGVVALQRLLQGLDDAAPISRAQGGVP